MATATHAQVASGVVRRATNGIRQNAKTGYTQGYRRWNGINHRIHYTSVTDWADCSSWVTWLIWDARIAYRGTAGTDIMNGLNWKAGNTASLVRHGHRHKLGPSAWYAGRTLVFYGVGGGGIDDIGHVTVWMGNGYEASHGRSAGPELKRHATYRPRDFICAVAYAI